MKEDRIKEQRFINVLNQYRDTVSRVCYLYASSSALYDDLYQETLINIWQGLDSFRGEAKISTWIYRTAINTCISWHRRNARHGASHILRLDDTTVEIPDNTENSKLNTNRELHRLISALNPIDKAFITLWLDEKSYAEIGFIMGISPGNVAVKIHRIKEKLSKIAKKSI